MTRPKTPCDMTLPPISRAGRRRAMAGAAGAVAFWLFRPGVALAEDLAAAIAAYAGRAPVKPGRVHFDIASLIDNGNSVPVTITVESPMTAADHVTAIALFNERNPQRDIARFTLGPRSGKAVVSTRIRLATSQKLVAVARMSDGTYWSQGVDVVVALASCIED